MPRLARTVVPGCAHQIAQRWAKFDYEYAANTSNIANMAYKHRGDSNEVDFTYDYLDRLTLAEYSVTEDSNEVFTIDDLGNRDNVNVRDGTDIDYVIDEYTNRYDSVDGNNLAYNEAGDLTTDKDGYIYEYDYENRITKITRDGNDIAEYAYDALGRRIWKRDSIADANNVYYYNDQWQVLVDFNDSDVEQQRFVYGNYIDEPILMVANGVEYQYLYDHLYNTVALTNSTGTPYERYEYDAYGNCHVLEPNFVPDSNGISDYGNSYLFTGRSLDILDNGSLKLQYNRNRYYDQYTGRWMTNDPLGYVDGMNLYEYVSSSPVAALDPNGLWENDTHYTRIYSWARNDNRMKEWAARQVAFSDNDVDPPWYEWPFHTTIANLSWHFDILHNANLAWANSDSRFVHAERELATAITICGGSKVDCSTVRLVAAHIGMALHPVQDWFAHGTWDPTTPRLNWRMHPPETDDADRDYRHTADRILRDQVRHGFPAHPVPLFQTGSARIIGTKHRTLEYLARFKNSLNKQGTCYCRIYEAE